MKRRGSLTLPSIFENCGLIETVYLHVSSLLKERLPSIPANLPKFENAYEDRYKMVFGSINWENFFESNKIEPLSPAIKQAIKTLFDRMNGETWISWLAQIHLLLSYFLFESDLAQPYKHSNFKLILEYYKFIRSEIEKQGLLIPEPFNETPLEKFWQIEKEETRRVQIKKRIDLEISKRLCPNCGARGKDIKKHSANRYMCNICGKTFPRKAKEVIV